MSVTTVTHAPAPWAFSDQREWTTRILCADGSSVCKISGGSRADAALISAAPDLLASLREFVTLYDGLDNSIGATVKAKLARARLAISKADGGGL